MGEPLPVSDLDVLVTLFHNVIALQIRQNVGRAGLAENQQRGRTPATSGAKPDGLWSIDETEDTEAVECDPMIVECYSTLGRAMGTSTEGQAAAYVSIPGPSPMRALRRSWRVTE